MTTTDAAKFLGVTQARVRQVILEGRLPAEKIGRDLHLKKEDVEVFKKTMRPVGRPAVKKTGDSES